MNFFYFSLSLYLFSQMVFLFSSLICVSFISPPLNLAQSVILPLSHPLTTSSLSLSHTHTHTHTNTPNFSHRPTSSTSSMFKHLLCAAWCLFTFLAAAKIDQKTFFICRSNKIFLLTLSPFLSVSCYFFLIS